MNNSFAFSLIKSFAFDLSCSLEKSLPFFLAKSNKASLTIFVEPNSFSLLPAKPEKSPSRVAIALPNITALLLASVSLTP